MYLLQHYVIKLVSAMRRWSSPVSSPNKSDCHDITQLLLKAALNTNNLDLIIKCEYLS